MTIFVDNKYAPGVTSDGYLPDQLIAGGNNLETQPIILASGNLKRGTVLGQVNAQSIYAIAGTNTGNGTVGSLTRETGSKTGDYQLVAKSATVFGVTDPEGAAMPDATAGTAYAQQGLKFTVTAGGAAFAAGDKFTLRAVDAVGQYKQSVATANDGSQTPSAILVDDADATAGPVSAGAYLAGEFNGRAIIFDATWTVATVRAALRAFGIFIKSSVSGAEPVG